MKLAFAPAAQSDLRDIAGYIARDNPERARSFINELRARCSALLEQPEIGTPRPDVRAGLRSKPHGRYVIFYSSTKSEVRVERILHSARDVQKLL